MENNILASLKMEIEGDNLSYKKASDFQGVLFTQVDSGYVEYLHREQLHPYSQHLHFSDGRIFWYVNTLSLEAYNQMIIPIMDDRFHTFTINNGNINARILSKELTTKGYSDLLDEFYSGDANRSITLKFLTHTAFKQRGRYNVTPDIRLIYQSLMMKYSAVSGNDSMIDEHTLEQLISNTMVSKYRLHTGVFPEEGRTIPGFVGTLTLRLFGTDTMARYARLLFEFGEFSGVGIKTGMGMGAFRIASEDKFENP